MSVEQGAELPAVASFSGGHFGDITVAITIAV
jgi:hypothetical protein